MIHKIAILLILVLCFIQCVLEIEGEIEYVYKLSSPTGNVDIYTCFIESPYAFTSGNIEKRIVEKEDKYNPRRSGNLHGYVVLGWKGTDTLKVIKFYGKKDVEVKISESKLHEVKNMEISF